ncbi:hypothetical protein D9619_008711 [Psilocybe cf. subviscida]|uniref:UBA domain-containing protein n=1 Tax=Psilocybe cf. subviscida TaxID=2480587 RepID=A0A8H5BA70_9AGAR|nr:hypothetical protein D9619_008711 [Psilocybe cf. subviscida]
MIPVGDLLPSIHGLFNCLFMLHRLRSKDRTDIYQPPLISCNYRRALRFFEDMSSAATKQAGGGAMSLDKMNNIAEMIRNDPSMRQSFIAIAAQRDPALGQQLNQSLQLLDTVASQGQSAAALAREEKAAVQRASLVALGFDQKKALVAYLASNKNVEQATNYLKNPENSKDATATKPPAAGRFISDNPSLRLGLNEFIAQKDPALAQQMKGNPALFEATLRSVGDDTDWKAEYEKARDEATWKANHDAIKASYGSQAASGQAASAAAKAEASWKSSYDSLKATYDALAASGQTVSTAVTNAALDYPLKTRSIRANHAYAGYSAYDAHWPDWLGYQAGEILYTNGYVVPTRFGNLYRVCNSSGRVGVAYADKYIRRPLKSSIVLTDKCRTFVAQSSHEALTAYLVQDYKDVSSTLTQFCIHLSVHTMAEDPKLTELVGDFLLYIVSWVNKTADDVLYNLSGLKGTWNEETDKKVNYDETPNKAEFLENIDEFLAKKENEPLAQFFKNDPSFIQDLAKNATELANDPTAPLGGSDLLPKLFKVSLHKQVIYCDDSSSMRREGRWAAQVQLVNRITRITTRILPEDDGVALRFINQTVNNSDKLNLQAVTSIMEGSSWQPGGNTEIGTYLKSKILEPLIYSQLQLRTLMRPYLISVITDGMPEPERKEAFVEAIKECGDKLQAAGYPRESVKFVLGQIGTGKAATSFLEGVRNNQAIKNEVYVTSDKLDERLSALKANLADLDSWLLQTLFEPIRKYQST